MDSTDTLLVSRHSVCIKPPASSNTQLPPIPPTEEVAAALVDPRYGSHGTCKANGIQLHYVETGVAFKGKGPAILFLHGFPEV